MVQQTKEHREDVNDNARLGTLTTDGNIEAVKKMILDNRRITMREVAVDVGKSFGSYQAMFADVLGIKPATAKNVLKFQNFDESCKTNVAWTSLRRRWRRFKFVQKGDNESYVYGYDIETKAETSQWKRPEEPKTEKSTSSSVKYEGFAHCFLTTRSYDK